MADTSAVEAPAQDPSSARRFAEVWDYFSENRGSGSGLVVFAILVLRRGFKARGHRKELERLSQVVWVPVPRTSVNPEYAGMARTARELAPAPVLPALPSAG